MGYAEFDLRIPVAALAGQPGADGGRGADDVLRAAVARAAGLGRGAADFTFAIVNKSLDARRKDRIEWQFRVGVSSPAVKGGEAPAAPVLEPGDEGRRPGGAATALVVGTGPAGIFAAAWLARSGFRVTVLERGSRVDRRKAAIAAFEAGGPFPDRDNYAFGEGGAGTFSDGKLSSRTKGIGAERAWIFDRLIEAGAPAEIAYMTHPHLGSDNLFAMTSRMRASLEALGVDFRFGSPALDLKVSGDRVLGVETGEGLVEADHVVFATGHSANETCRMLMARGVPFRPKNFAIGFRAEHEQALVNRAQWGVDSLPGVKAAEYRLTAKASDGRGVYSFCMCPGGTVVPAAAYDRTCVVNGKSDYARDGRRANAAIVAELDLQRLLGREVSAAGCLDWLEALERSYWEFDGSWRVPAMTARDFLAGKSGSALGSASYPLGLAPADLRELLPAPLATALREGLSDFCRKLRGYETGLIMGLESKTSSPVQVVRDPERLNARYANLYVAGEGAGWSGGIVSSAADGLKAARSVCRAEAEGRGGPR